MRIVRRLLTRFCSHRFTWPRLDGNGQHYGLSAVPVRFRIDKHEYMVEDLLGRWVRIRGWMLFDVEHQNQSKNTAPGRERNWRATAWEIHPITSVDAFFCQAIWRGGFGIAVVSWRSSAILSGSKRLQRQLEYAQLVGVGEPSLAKTELLKI